MTWKPSWVRRAEAERAKRIEAEERRDRIRSEWERTHTTVGQTRREDELNNWSATVRSIFSGGVGT